MVVAATEQQTAVLLVNNVVVLLRSQQVLQSYLQLTLHPTHQSPPSKPHREKLVTSRETEARDRNKLIFQPRYAQRMFNIHGWLTCTFDAACWAA